MISFDSDKIKLLHQLIAEGKLKYEDLLNFIKAHSL